jgi:hypothetical protein
VEQPCAARRRGRTKRGIVEFLFIGGLYFSQYSNLEVLSQFSFEGVIEDGGEEGVQHANPIPHDRRIEVVVQRGPRWRSDAS